ncbi:MAG TPA: TraB/GumN family protein [Chryseolinea sp.]
MGRGSNLRVFFLAVVLIYAWPSSVFPQSPQPENSVFWQVSGKDLAQPSYLFGTFHLMGARYVDSLTHVIEKFGESKTLVGELLLDSTMTVKMMVAARLHETTLDKLLGTEDYEKTAAWLKELSGYDLKIFNGMNPMTIQIFLMTMLQQKYYPLGGSADVPMDMYLQQRGKQEGKKLVGLESFEVQVNALFSQFSIQRQAEMLIEFVNEKEKAKEELLLMNKSYRNGDLRKLEELMALQTYSENEAKVMLDDRNKNWMGQLPSLMKEQQTFIAVGALHLSGKNGLIHLLREAGYTVTPLHSK